LFLLEWNLCAYKNPINTYFSFNKKITMFFVLVELVYMFSLREFGVLDTGKLLYR
jgi:hypothetical protein